MNLKNILSDAGVSAFNTSISIISRVILVPVIITQLGTAEYGIWTTIIALVGLLVLIGDMHLHGALVRFSDSTNDSQVFVDIFTLSSISSIFLSSISFILGMIAFSLLSLSVVSNDIVLPISLLVGTSIVWKVLVNYFRSINKVKIFEILKFLRNAVGSLVVVVVFSFFNGDLADGVWTKAGISTVFLLVVLPYLFYRNTTKPDTSNFKRYLKYCIPMIPKEIAGKLLHSADRFLIIYFLGPSATGIYSVAYVISSIIQQISSVFDSTLYPRVTSAWDNDKLTQLQEFYTNFIQWYLFLGIPAVFGISVIGEELAGLISNTMVASEVTVILPILAAGFLFQGLEFPLSFLIAAANKTRRIALITVVSVVLNLALNIILIPWLGIAGAAFATLCAYAVRTLFLYYCSLNYLKIEIDTSIILKPLIGSLVMVGILIHLPSISGIGKLLIFPFVGATVYLLVILGIHGTPQSLKSLLE